MDVKLREAQRALHSGSISYAEYNALVTRATGRPEKPLYNYRDFIAKPGANTHRHGDDYPYGVSSSLHYFLTKPAVVLSSEAVGDYQGVVYGILAVVGGPLYKGVTTFAMWSDYFGSCGGCDSYMDSSYDENFDMIKGSVSNVSQFWSLDEIKTFVENEKDPGEYTWNPFPINIIEEARKALKNERHNSE